MKCPKCGAVNKKTDERCKKCDVLLHEEVKEEQAIEEVKVEETPQVVKEEVIKEEIIKVAKKKRSPFRKFLLIIRIIILLLIISIIGLVLYIYLLFDYNKYYEDNITRYYETENKQYLNSVKLLFKVYRLDDNKISKMQDKGLDLTSLWIDELKNNKYTSEEEYREDLTYLERVIDALYNETEYEGHTAISKKSYNSLSFSIKDLKSSLEPSNGENLPEINDRPTNETNYDVSKFNELDINNVLSLFEQKDLAVIYMGRESCHFCVQYVPILNAVQEELGFKTYYLDTLKIDVTSENYDKFIAKLDKKYEMDGENKTLGEFYKTYGYTPITIIIKNGKMIDGHIGYTEKNALKELVSKYL